MQTPTEMFPRQTRNLPVLLTVGLSGLKHVSLPLLCCPHVVGHAGFHALMRPPGRGAVTVSAFNLSRITY